MPLTAPNPEPARVLLVDDEANFRRVLRRELTDAGFAVAEAGRGDEALERLRAEPFDVVLLDLKMPGIEGLGVLREARRAGCGAEVIVLTGHGTIDSVVEAMKLGAFDYATKPCRLAEIELLVSRAADRRRGGSRGGVRTGPQPGTPGGASPAAAADEGEILAASPAIEGVLRLIDKAAPTDAPVLIEGESGTGKELLARRLHSRSRVADGPFIVVNCGAIQDTLILSELFGHEKGAFTGADRQKIGLLEQASLGTAFLDEIGELTPEAQVRLLRFLQFGELRRVGGTNLINVKVRVVAATNRRLLDEAREGRFREDLFYRLHTIQVTIPPLRDRPEEIPALARRFLARSASGRGRAFEPDALALLVGYPWPGNVRELENIVERLAILSEGEAIGRADVLAHFEGLALMGREGAGGAGDRPDAAGAAGSVRTLRELERSEIAAALVRNEGDKVRTAAELGISLKTLYNKIKAYAIQV